MHNMAKAIIRQIINKRNIKAFNEFSEISLGGRLVVNEYAGSEIRVFNRDKKTHLLFPHDITPIQEGALAEAIESGEIFDDADTAERAATYITHTTLPIRAMANKSIELPKGLPNMTAAVIGVMDDKGHIPCDQTNIDNGCQFVKDICKSKYTDNTVKEIVDDYFGIREDDNLPTEIGSDIVDIERKLREDLINFDPDDSIDEDDYEEVEIEEGFFSSLSPDTTAKLIYHLHTMNDIVNNPLLPDQPKSSDQSLNALDECMTEGRQLSRIAEKCINDGKFDRQTAQLLNVVRLAADEMSVAADTISNPFLKQEDIEDNEVGAKEAVQKWSTNKETIRKTLPRVIKMVEEGQGKPVTEGFLSRKPKKLKPIPARDIIVYVTTEMNAIQDANDQSMLAGFVCSKLEIADFYLSCIDNNDERYIVPHNRQFIIQYQNDLNRLLTQILKIRPVNRNDRVWKINVNYPENWRG